MTKKTTKAFQTKRFNKKLQTYSQFPTKTSAPPSFFLNSYKNEKGLKNGTNPSYRTNILSLNYKETKKFQELHPYRTKCKKYNMTT